MNEKTAVILGTLCTIILSVLASIIAWFAGGNKLQGASREIIRKMFNIEINLCIVAAVLAFIPVIGQFLAPIVFVVNIVIAVMAYSAYNNKTEFSIPHIEIIK